jgi:amylosucrase
MMRSARDVGDHPQPTAGATPTLARTAASWSLTRATQVAVEELEGLAERDVELFTVRLARWWSDLAEGWAPVYESRPDGAIGLERLIRMLAHRYRERRPGLRHLDLERVLRPDWFQDPSMIGYVCYPARFGGSIAGVGLHLDYLEELQIRYLHLMPLLRTRDGETDGGYAVADYRSVDPSLGTIDDLEHLCDELRTRGMSLCVDLVLNHTAAEHAWATAARAGDPAATAMYRVFPDRTLPDQYERTLPEVFPDLAPGNFTQLEDGRWVWTTFNSFQWDLDWSNPAVFVEMTDGLLDLANRGVEVFRLDAVAFLWKRLGTNCQNQPEVHDLLQAIRASVRIAAPAVILKAEAIVGPDHLPAYLGVGRHQGRVSDMAYHNSLMVQFWSSLATRDTRLMTEVLRGLPRKPATTAWATYIRCHDDIGWAITEEDAARVGWDGKAHRTFLSTFYTGEFPGSFARGALFSHVPETGDSRISGTLASLAGLEAGLEAGLGADDPSLIDDAIARIRLGHALILAWDGVPLIYMGDELGLLNDRSYADDPDHLSDNRWLHRPVMDWRLAERRHRPETVEGRIFADLRDLVAARRAAPQLHAANPLDIVDAAVPGVFAFIRRHPAGDLSAIFNFTEFQRTVGAPITPASASGRLVDLLDGSRLPSDSPIEVPRLGVRWLIPFEPKP